MQILNHHLSSPPPPRLPANLSASPRRRWTSLGWRLALFAGLVGVPLSAPISAAELPGGAAFHREVQPVLKEFCYDCHGDGAKKGNVSFDTFASDQALLDEQELWWKALKMLRAGLMPPENKPRPSGEQQQQIETWIKSAVFGADPQHPDPGRVTVRRLNRTEYKNTVRDLLGVEFDTEKEFPPDDTGHGFDNIADVLTLPPMLLEKYLAAARAVVAKAVPEVPAVPAERLIPGREFSGEIGVFSRTNRAPTGSNGLTLSYYEPSSISNTWTAPHTASYQLLLDFTANERFVDNQFDYNKCRVVFRADGRELLRQEYSREGGKPFHYEFAQEWTAGPHTLSLELEPLTPDQKQVRSLTLRLDSTTLRGPMAARYWVRPKNYERFFPRETPKSASARRAYAREILAPFVERAYRRPVDAKSIDRLVAFAEETYRQPGKTFEAGIGQAMAAVLASPRFLFREEGVERGAPSGTHPLVDEYALASRLSYFFWSSLPDDELIRLAGQSRLRKELAAQTQRLLADRKADAFVRNFVGQWLQTRDIETVTIDARQVLGREAAPDPDFERRRQRFRELRDKPESELTAAEKKELEESRGNLFRRFGRAPRAELTGDLRRAMRQETERTFDYVLHQDHSLLELLDSDYTFLNERLARHYGLTNLNVKGDEMRLVHLPADSDRGGVITHGSVLAVTSNPTRTSPVKRGLFILDNLLGTPPPPPPPDIPPLEDAAKDIKDRPVSLRETLALHREKPLCSSCHNRMDPLGLALENYNAMGMWRDRERNQPIDAAGKLLTGESFTNVSQLKHILATRHATEFYRTITEKLLTYALGRGLEYYDVVTVDTIVQRLLAGEGRASILIAGVVDSAPFQRTRRTDGPSGVTSADAAKDRTRLRPTRQPE
jgi:mono/diheme cytochrome c family protein